MIIHMNNMRKQNSTKKKFWEFEVDSSNLIIIVYLY